MANTLNMGPIAYGTVLADGTLKANSGNVTVIKGAAGQYQISISGESYIYYNYITTDTLIGSHGFISHVSVSNKLNIYTYNSAGTAANIIFSFVVYKP